MAVTLDVRLKSQQVNRAAFLCNNNSILVTLRLTADCPTLMKHIQVGVSLKFCNTVLTDRCWAAGKISPDEVEWLSLL